jgi:S-DNA-T family DNA segregation ATPase FtsK/SpoIIIE
MRNEKKLAENIENAIVKICQKGRAAGIHLIISTSCTCKDVITPILKFNFPTSIAFRVGSADCSKVILDKTGAEKLKGCGDMLMQLSSEGKLLRCQGAYVDDKMIKEFIDALVPCKAPEIDPLDLPVENMESIAEEIKKFIRSDDTQGFLEAVKFVITMGKTGTRYLQEHLHIGYNRAAEYMDLLRERGVIPQ